MSEVANSWYQETLRNPYPFVDTASLTDASGLLKLQKGWIIEARIWASMETAARTYLRSIARTKDLLTFTISTTEEDLCTAEVTDFTKTRLAFFDAGGSQVGYMTFAPGALSLIHDRASQVYQFSVDAAEFTAGSVISVRSSGLNSIRDAQAAAISEELILVGGEGIALHVIDGSTIRVDVIGDPYFRRDICDDRDFLGRVINPVRQIAWMDKVSGEAGVCKPFTGAIVTAVAPGRVNPRERGYASPGPGFTILSMLGA